MFSDREKFIQAITVFMISPDARKIPVDKRQMVLDFIRKQHCPSVDDEEWSQIAKEVNVNKHLILESLANYDKEPKDDSVDTDNTDEPDNIDDETDFDEEEADLDEEPEEKPKKKFGFNFGKRGEKKKSGGKSISSIFKKNG